MIKYEHYEWLKESSFFHFDMPDVCANKKKYTVIIFYVILDMKLLSFLPYIF